MKKILILLCLFIFAPKLQAQETEDSIKFANQLSAAFENVSERISPSTVNISSITKPKQVKALRNGPDALEDHPFREFFGDDFFEKLFRQQAPRGYSQGMGTGVIIRKEGYILTNNHVVGDADEITVRLHNKKEYKAEVIGTDPKTDLAVIKIDAPNLTPADLGDSDNLKIGEWVVAVGNPFGLDYTITAGIVSAKGRANVGIVDYENFIQTDAAINPGNSGGPLVNLRGQVVGINAAIFSKSGGSMGIGFAIPVNMAKYVVDSLISKGKVIRGYLGVMIQNLDEDLANSFGHENTDGALVGDVSPNSPASEAGIEQGDIILTLNGTKIKDVTHLRKLVAETTPNAKVKVDLLRNKKSITKTVKIGELDAIEDKVEVEQDQEFDLGVALKDITPEIARAMGLKATKGAIVSQIVPGSVAQRSGLRPGDIILEVNGSEIESVDDFRTLMKKVDSSKGIRLVVQTGDFQRFVFIRPQ
ncbi:MAG: DegQ family serine endoprotease [Deltaproteobacteria bacterium]|nr:DegQ family serine endoprotease [Deltaproteobacteria bacterium]